MLVHFISGDSYGAGQPVGCLSPRDRITCVDEYDACPAIEHPFRLACTYRLRLHWTSPVTMMPIDASSSPISAGYAAGVPTYTQLRQIRSDRHFRPDRRGQRQNASCFRCQLSKKGQSASETCRPVAESDDAVSDSRGRATVLGVLNEGGFRCFGQMASTRRYTSHRSPTRPLPGACSERRVKELNVGLVFGDDHFQR